jgi:nitrate reductase (cytochrome)
MTKKPAMNADEEGPLPCGVSRRSFLRRLAATSAALAGATMLPETALSATGLSATEPAWKRVPCHLCPARCGLLIAIDNGRAVAMRADPDAPVNRGTACARGYHSVEGLYGRDRLKRALVRRGGVLREASLSEALDLVAARFRETISRRGPDAVALYRGADWVIPDGLIASMLFRDVVGTRNFDTTSRLGSASAAAGLRSTFGSAAPVASLQDLDRSDVFVIWNSNLAESDPVLFSRILQRKRANPAVRVVTISTRGTRTTWAADHALTIRPHTEIAVANAICHDIAGSRRMHRDFVNRHVSFKRGRVGIGHGLEGEAVSPDTPADASLSEYLKFLDQYSPRDVERLSGIAAESIRWLASLYTDPALKVMSVWGAELNAHSRGTWTNNAIYNIHLLVGKIASAGNGAMCVTGGTELDLAGRDVISIMRAVERGEVRLLWVQGADPLTELPNAARYEAALTTADRFLVVSSEYPTATTDVADVVLPTAAWLERPGILADGSRRLVSAARLVSPPGDARSEGWQMIEVSRRIGYGDRLPADADRVDAIYESFVRGAGARSKLPPVGALRSDAGAGWPWTDGRAIEWPYNTAHDPAADRRHGSFDFYGNPDRRAWIWLRPFEAPAESPDARFPLWLETGVVLEHGAGTPSTRRVPALHRAVPASYVEINRDDARALGIRAGDVVRLVSRRGSLEIGARVDNRSQPARGQLFVPTFDGDHRVNALLIDACCPLSGQPERAKCAVRLEKTGRRVSS